MVRRLLMLTAVALYSAAPALAQESGVGAGPVEIAAIPVGGVVFLESADQSQPKFRNYVLGASVTGNVNKFVGIEGDVSFAIGRNQDLNFVGGVLTNQKTPNLWSYTGNVIVNPWRSDRILVPYVAAGAGAMTLMNTPDAANLGLTTNQTYFTTNLGGGLRWFPAQHFGIRGDYRYFMIHNNVSAPAFFGQTQDRHANRVYGSLILTF